MKKNKWMIVAMGLVSCCFGVIGHLKSEEISSKSATRVSAEGSLEEITKPYMGVYECESLYFGGEDKKDIFEYFRIELKSKGELLLSYKLKKGRVEQIPLSYEYDFEEKTLRVYGQWGIMKVDKKFPVNKGEIAVSMNILGKLAVLKFSRP